MGYEQCADKSDDRDCRKFTMLTTKKVTPFTFGAIFVYEIEFQSISI